MSLIVQHRCIDREVAAQLKSTLCLCLTAGEPVQHDFALCRWQVCLDVIQHDFCRTDAMHRDDFVARLGTTLQHVLKHLLL